MASIKAHIFNSIQEAESAISQINSALGIPVSEDAVTRTYCTQQENNGNIFIYADEVTEGVLGASTDLELVIELPI